MIFPLISLLLSVENAFSFSFQGCFVEPNWTTMTNQLNPRQNNPKCTEFCLEQFFVLAATSGSQCVCMDSLPTDVVAFSAEGNAAAGSTSRCNIKCPGDAGTYCVSETCCGGSNNVFSVYATGNVDFVGKLMRNLGRTDVLTPLFPDAVGDPSLVLQIIFKVRMTGNVERICSVTVLHLYTASSCENVNSTAHMGIAYVEFEVERMEEKVAKSYPTQSQPLSTPGVELDNTGSSVDAHLTKTRSVSTTTSQTYTTESGSENSFTIGLSVSAGFAAFGADFSVDLSAEYSHSFFYNYGYESSNEDSITDTFDISTPVPAGKRKVVHFSKRFADRTLKWRSTCYAKGKITLVTGLTELRNISLSEALSPDLRMLYGFGTIRGEANPIISAVIDTYDSDGNLIDSRPANSSEVHSVSTNNKKFGRKHDHRNGLRKDKKRGRHYFKEH